MKVVYPPAGLGLVTRIDRKLGDGTSGTLSFTSIPQTYDHLLLVIFGRSSQAATDVGCNLVFNGDTSAIYDYEYIDGANAVVTSANASAQTSAFVCQVAAATAAASTPSMADVLLPGYAQTSLDKAWLARNGLKRAAATTFLDAVSGWYRSTSGISQIDAVLTAGNWVSGSIVSLYGM